MAFEWISMRDMGQRVADSIRGTFPTMGLVDPWKQDPRWKILFNALYRAEMLAQAIADDADFDRVLAEVNGWDQEDEE